MVKLGSVKKYLCVKIFYFNTNLMQEGPKKGGQSAGKRTTKVLRHVRFSLKMATKTSKESYNLEKKVINKWDGSACKNALDDAVRDVLTKKFNYTETFGLIDIRLFMCGMAVGIAMFGLLWDHLYPFPLSRQVLATCVSVYFIITGILTLYTSYLEKGIFAVAIQKDGKNGRGNVWEASSYMKKFDDKYSLLLTLKDGKSGHVCEMRSCKSVSQYIDENGTLLYDLVEQEVSNLHNKLLPEKKGK